MAQWGRNDKAVTATGSTTTETSTGAPIGTYALVKGGRTGTITPVSSPNADFGNTSAGSKASIDVAMFNNTTIGVFTSGRAVGVFGVSATEAQNTTYSLATSQVTFGGSGYQANATVSLTLINGGASGVVNAFANTTAGSTRAGRITALNIETIGSGYQAPPLLTVAAPAAISFYANSTGFSNGTVAGAANSSINITTANSFWQVGDRLFYGVPSGSTPIAPLTGNSYYYISFSNTTVIKITNTSGGANIAFTDTRVLGAADTHTIRGDTATGVLTSSASEYTGLAHAGWVLRTEGTGGRAGRVQYETLVAMGTLGSTLAAHGTAATTTDASDATILPGA
jgi:hypothetical protein